MILHIQAATSLAGVYLADFLNHQDERGAFFEVFKQSTLAHQLNWGPPVQFNVSQSAQGVIRGLHYQEAPFAQGKWVMCLQGEIFDVVLDLRADSPTYGQWESFLLQTPYQAVLIPPGCAHGFEALAESNWVQYLVFCAEYHPEAERGVAYNDPALAIPWRTRCAQVSPKDQQWPLLKI